MEKATKSEWRVTSNYIGGKTMYAVYQLRNISEVDHSGNRNYATNYTESKEEAVKIAEQLNQEEGIV